MLSQHLIYPQYLVIIDNIKMYASKTSNSDAVHIELALTFHHLPVTFCPP